jgi:hypothetical protein
MAFRKHINTKNSVCFLFANTMDNTNGRIEIRNRTAKLPCVGPAVFKDQLSPVIPLGMICKPIIKPKHHAKIM